MMVGRLIMFPVEMLPFQGIFFWGGDEGIFGAWNFCEFQCGVSDLFFKRARVDIHRERLSTKSTTITRYNLKMFERV